MLNSNSDGGGGLEWLPGEGIMAHNILWVYGMNVLGGIYTIVNAR